MANTLRWVAGCMTGTSLDGLDVALVRIVGRGLDMTAAYHAHISVSFDDMGEHRHTLAALTAGEACEPLRILRASRALGQLHAAAVSQLCQHLPADQRLHLVVAHGQTVWHQPQEHLSWQLFDPWPLVRALRTPVVYDLRQADLVAGGEGAPLTPLADWVLLRHARRRRAVVNLGGICNVTHLPAGGSPDNLRGGDIGPCNILLDGLTQRLYPDRFYDDRGQLAARGSASSAVHQLLQSARPGTKRSLGREDYDAAFLDRLVQLANNASPETLLASAALAVARMIAGATEDADELILAGGGARNDHLVQQIHATCKPRLVRLSSELELPIEAREAVGFAILGALAEDGVPITLPAVTGRRHQPPRAGTWVYPNDQPET